MTIVILHFHTANIDKGIDFLAFSREVGVAHSCHVLSPAKAFSFQHCINFKTLGSLGELKHIQQCKPESSADTVGSLPSEITKTYYSCKSKSNKNLRQLHTEPMEKKRTIGEFCVTCSFFRFFFMSLFLYCKCYERNVIELMFRAGKKIPLLFIIQFVLNFLSLCYQVLLDTSIETPSILEAIVCSKASPPYYVASTSKEIPFRELFLTVKPPNSGGIKKVSAWCACHISCFITARNSKVGLLTSRTFIRG